MLKICTILFLIIGNNVYADEVKKGPVILESRDPNFQAWVHEMHLEYLACQEIDGGFYAVTVELLGEDAPPVDETTRAEDRIYFGGSWYTEEEFTQHLMEVGCPSDATS